MYYLPNLKECVFFQAVEVSLYGLEEIASNSTTIEQLIDLALSKTCVADVVSRYVVIDLTLVHCTLVFIHFLSASLTCLLRARN